MGSTMGATLKIQLAYCFQLILAERVGFEPTVQFPAHTLSKRAP
jgi:hypothetical protein